MTEEPPRSLAKPARLVATVGSVCEDSGGFRMLPSMGPPFPDVDVMPEQGELLVLLVAAARAVPSDGRENSLHIGGSFSGLDVLFHPGP